jgi:hypothetical protein
VGEFRPPARAIRLMPTLERSAPPETTAPGLTRRRLWRPPAVRSHSLVCLTLTKLYLAPATAAVKPEAAEAVQNGADPDAAFGPLATVVPLATVRRVKLALLTNALTVEYARPVGHGSGVVPRPVTLAVVIEFADYETADEVFTKLWRRLGQGFGLKPRKRDPWELARLPVAAMGGVLAATLALGLAANAVADGGPAGGWRSLLAFDWRWACGLGGVALAALQVWLYRRLTTPPVMLELIPK